MEALDEIKNTTETTVPKKRGRPVKPDKIVKLPSGRGRGRPSKNTSSTITKPIQKGNNVEGLKEESNGKSNSDSEKNTSTRGRPRKLGKTKLLHPIVATGKGRGRPKKSNKEDGIDRKRRSISKTVSKATSGQNRGRPRKQNSDGESSEENEEERRPVGRPLTGGLDLNIQRTGRGQGRPKKHLAEKRVVASTDEEASTLPKKRGRPSGVSRKPSPPSDASKDEEINQTNDISRDTDTENIPSCSEE